MAKSRSYVIFNTLENCIHGDLDGRTLAECILDLRSMAKDPGVEIFKIRHLGLIDRVIALVRR